eukprot:Rmarinus@m.10137
MLATHKGVSIEDKELESDWHLGLRQLRAVLYVRATYKLRNKKQTLWEIAAPLLLISLLVFGYSMSDVEHNDAQNYADLYGFTDILDEFVNCISTSGDPMFEMHIDIENPDYGPTIYDNVGNMIDLTSDEIIDIWTTNGTQFSINGTELTVKTGNVTLLYDLDELSEVAEVTYFEAAGVLVSLEDSDCISASAFTDVNSVQDYYVAPLLVPTFDMYVGLTEVLLRVLDDDTRDDLDAVGAYSGFFGLMFDLGDLAFAPDTPEVAALVDHLNSTTVYFREKYVGTFLTEDDAINYAVGDGADTLWALVVMKEMDLNPDGSLGENGKIEYSIRMNYTNVANTKYVVRWFGEGIDEDFLLYYTSGFLSLQSEIEAYTLGKVEGANGTAPASLTLGDFFGNTTYVVDVPANITVSSNGTEIFHLDEIESHVDFGAETVSFYINGTFVGKRSFQDILPEGFQDAASMRLPAEGVPFPTPAYDENIFYAAVGFLLGLIFCMGYLYPTSRLIREVVEEKEIRMREVMKIMGLLPTVHVLSWVISAVLMFFVIAVGATLLLSASFLPNTSVSVLFVYFMVFGVSQIFLAFLVCSFFSKAKLAATVGPILVFLTVMPKYVFFGTTRDEAVTEKYFLSLLSPVAFAFAADELVLYEGANMGVSWNNMHEGGFSFADCLTMMFVDIILYAVLAWYCDNVVPAAWGTQKHPLFFLKKSYWTGVGVHDPTASDVSSDEMGSDYEVVDNLLRPRASVMIQNLRKVYPNGKVAVDGMKLTLYDGQITALLGHNGAGKSTLLSILNGLLPSTSGDCVMYGKRLSTELPRIRRFTGFCPQDNVLHAKMAVIDHLWLFAMLKGVPSDRAMSEATEMMCAVGLEASRNVFSSALSGGMKRKLCCGMALIGGSRLVFLDEPTSGMDPYSRRAIWSLFREHKTNRTLVLTTHFMDEADLLADRIAIMDGGQLRTCGSSLFLKSRFGVGYNLTMVKASDQCNVEVVLKAIQAEIPEAGLTGAAGGEIVFELPLKAVPQFPALFQKIDSQLLSLFISEYGISMTTLEEVFLRITRGTGALNSARVLQNPPSADGGGDYIQPQASLPIEVEDYLTPRENTHESDSLSRSSFDSTSKLTTVAPSDTSLLQKATEQNARMSINLGLPGPSLTVGGDASISDAARPDSRLEVGTGILPLDGSAWRKNVRLWVQLLQMVKKRAICSSRDMKALLFQVVLPVLAVALTLLIIMLNINFAGPRLLLRPGDMYTPAPSLIPYTYSAIGNLTDETATSTIDFITSELDQCQPYHEVSSTNASTLSEHLLETENDHDISDNRFGAYVWPPVSLDSGLDEAVSINTTTWRDFIPVILHNGTSPHALPAFMSLASSARLRYASGREDAEFLVSSHPLPMTERQELLVKTLLSLFASLFILIPLCYIPAAYAIFIVKERTCKAKHLQLVSGTNLYMFWLGTYLWDMLMFSITATMIFCLYYIYGNDELIGSSESATLTFLLHILYGASALPLSYCYSFLFSSHSAAQVGVAALNFLTGFAFVCAQYIMQALPKTRSVNSVLVHFYRLFPPYNFGDGLLQASTVYYENTYLNQDISYFDWDVGGRPLFWMAVEIGGYWVLLFLIENKMMLRVYLRLRAFISKDVYRSPPFDEDDDVASERDRVASGQAEGENLVLRGLRKVYYPRGNAAAKVAVHDLWLGVPVGECFGFLGINGAGKSTTMNMLTGDLQPTSGSASINGYDVVRDLKKAQRDVGYTPQTDPLLEWMTAREHLEIFGRLKGIPDDRIHSLAEHIMISVGLGPFMDKCSGTYSGGTKRKLSLAIALIGQPKLVFLDEPSTGMDPLARRQMWDAIIEVGKRCSIVLTTHSMEECEALCSRVGIMVAGRLHCLGPIQHLKSKFGGGYFLEINAPSEAMEGIQTFISTTFKGAVCEEFFGTRVKYALPAQDMTLSQVFRLIEGSKKDLRITDYSVSQSTLEQLFVRMARDEDHEHDSQNPEPNAQTPWNPSPDANANANATSGTDVNAPTGVAAMSRAEGLMSVFKKH